MDDVPYNSHTKRLTPPPFQCLGLPALVCANFVSLTLQVQSFRKVHFASQQRWYQVISPTQNNVANFDFQNVDASFFVKIMSHFNQTLPTLALDLKSSSMSSYLGLVERPLDQRGILKHFPQSICIFISHWSREK